MINLLKASIALIKKDKFILIPSIIGAFVTTWLVVFLNIDPNNLNQNPNILIYFGISWAINIFLQLLIAGIGSTLINHDQFSFSTAIATVFKKYLSTILWSTLIFIAVMSQIVLISMSKIFIIIALPIVIISTILLQLFPIVYVVSGQPTYRIVGIIITFMKNNIRKAINVFSLIIFISLLSILILSAANALPASIKSVTSPFIHGFFQVLLNIALLIFWKSNITKINVKIK